MFEMCCEEDSDEDRTGRSELGVLMDVVERELDRVVLGLPIWPGITSRNRFEACLIFSEEFIVGCCG